MKQSISSRISLARRRQVAGLCAAGQETGACLARQRPFAGWHAQAAFAWACCWMSGVHAHANGGVGMPPGYPE
jgi:hypothetical protein